MQLNINSLVGPCDGSTSTSKEPDDHWCPDGQKLFRSSRMPLQPGAQQLAVQSWNSDGLCSMAAAVETMACTLWSASLTYSPCYHDACQLCLDLAYLQQGRIFNSRTGECFFTGELKTDFVVFPFLGWFSVRTLMLEDFSFCGCACWFIHRIVSKLSEVGLVSCLPGRAEQLHIAPELLRWIGCRGIRSSHCQRMGCSRNSQNHLATLEAAWSSLSCYAQHMQLAQMQTFIEPNRANTIPQSYTPTRGPHKDSLRVTRSLFGPHFGWGLYGWR